MSIANKLDLLKDSKEGLRQSIISKGISCDETTPFSEYATKISSIPTTGEGPSNAILNGTDITGLVCYFDGIDNKGMSHSSSGAWISKTGGWEGTLKNSPKWGENCLILDGTNDWVSVGRIDITEAITLEAVVMHSSIPDKTVTIAGNIESGGYALYYIPTEGFRAYLHTGGEDYNRIVLAEPLEANKIYYVACTFDGTKATIMSSTLGKAELDCPGTIKKPSNNTIFVIGGNASGSGTYGTEYFPGNIYSIRLWRRALTDSEIKQNMRYEQDRYGF